MPNTLAQTGPFPDVSEFSNSARPGMCASIPSLRFTTNTRPIRHVCCEYARAAKLLLCVV